MKELILFFLLSGVIGYLIGVGRGKPHPEYFTTRRKIKGTLTEVKHLN